jgi:hypothetical protein
MTLTGMIRTAGISVAFAVSACNEDQHARYATYADAVHDGAVERGWIPDYVPRGATEIAEVHNLDTNAQLLRFQASPEALATMVARLVPAPSGTAPAPPRYLSPPPGRLWRRDLRSGALAEGLSGYRARLEPGRLHCIAVDSQRGVAYAWTCTD